HHAGRKRAWAPVQEGAAAPDPGRAPPSRSRPGRPGSLWTGHGPVSPPAYTRTLRPLRARRTPPGRPPRRPAGHTADAPLQREDRPPRRRPTGGTGWAGLLHAPRSPAKFDRGSGGVVECPAMDGSSRNAPAPDEAVALVRSLGRLWTSTAASSSRSEEHTSELQSRENLVCRLLLEKKKKKK